MGRAEDIVMSKSRCSPWGMCTLVLNQEWYTHTYSKAFEKVTPGGHNQCAKLPTQNCSHGSRSFKSHRMALPESQNGIDTWTEPQPNHKGHTHVGEQNFATVSQSWLLHLEKPAWLLCSLSLRPCANSIPTRSLSGLSETARTLIPVSQLRDSEGSGHLPQTILWG